MKIRTILSFIFFWPLGIFGLYVMTQPMMTGGERLDRMLMPGEHCFLLKYSMVLGVASFCIVMILIPVLMYMIFPRGNAAPPDEHMIRKKKVLFEVIVSSMAAPGFLLMGIGWYVDGAEPVRLFLLGSIPVGWYVSQIITLLSYRKK